MSTLNTVTESVTTSADQKPTNRDFSGEIVWKPLYRVAGIAALISVGLIPIAIIVYIVSPPPSNVLDWFTLLQINPLVGLIDLDLVMLLSYVLVVPIFLGLYVALRRASESFMALATTLQLVGITIYLTSNPSLSMLSLSGQYANATTDAQRTILLAAGQAVLATWQGTAFDVSYVLGGVSGLMIALVMLQSNIFSKAIVYVGIVLYALMLVPPTVGTIGLVLAFLSLIPLAVWLVLIAHRFFQLGQDIPSGVTNPRWR